jgi:hypothetical protein
MLVGFAIIFAAFGFGLLYSSYLKYRIAQEGLAAPALIVRREFELVDHEAEMRRNPGRESMYWMIDYRDTNEKVHTQKVWVDVKDNTRTSAQVLYLREQPEDAVLDFQLATSPWKKGVTLSGILLSAAALLVYFAHKTPASMR